MFKVVVKIPELKREVTLVCNPQQILPKATDYLSPYLGCHAGFMGNLNLQWIDADPTGTDTLRDTENTGTSLRTKTSWGKAYPQTETDAVRKFLEKYSLPEDQRNTLFEQVYAQWATPLGDKISRSWQTPIEGGKYPIGCTFVVMADNINAYTPEFPKNSGIHHYGFVNNVKVYDFIQWIIAAKGERGVVVGSPVGRNQHHQTEKNFSLTQMWIWTPPQHTQFLLPNSTVVAGTGAIPEVSNWYKEVKANLPHLKTDEDVNTSLFRGGKPPMFASRA